MMPTTDIDIRAALHAKKLRIHHDAPETIVIDELGLSHARVRVDVAVINGCIHGYEIKSGLDTLDRLPAQLQLYTQCLEKLTIVCASRHVTKVEILAPTWSGIVEATKGSRGGIRFSTVRRTGINTGIEATQLAHLLWRDEVVALLKRYDVPAKAMKAPRKELYRMLAQFMTISEITDAIRKFMVLRPKWRYLPARA
jgi:hypothetical protein